MDLYRRSEPTETKELRFDALYRDYYGRVLAYALRRAAPELAHDVVADTFLVAWRRLGRVPDQPLPWLLGVARKTLANHRRSARRREALLTELKANDAVRLRGANEDLPVTVAEVEAALRRLPASDRELLQLIAWDGLSVVEAAEVLGKSPATTRVRLHRARRRLARDLSGEEPQPARPDHFQPIAKEQP